METRIMQIIEKLNSQEIGITLVMIGHELGESILVLGLKGELETANSHSFFISVREIIDGGGFIEKIVLDLRDLNYVSSTGIGSFTQLLVQAKQNNISLLLCSVGVKVRSVLDLLGFTSFFTIIESLEQLKG
ncbi:MAG: STAS domain-containing protein [Spirochaetales bacterium]|nr:STAS domain-containing protein [Spirochaetales bacterium]